MVSGCYSRFYGAAFAKVKIKSGYLGGLVGGLLHSSNFEYFNSNTALTNGTQGAMWTHSGKILSLRDVARGGAQVLDVSGSYLAPYRHMNMRDYRIFGVEVYAALRKSVVYDVRTFTFAGNGTVSTVREVWRATISCTLDGVSGECLIYVSSSGINIVNNTMNDVTLSVSGMKFQAVQGAQDVLATTFNFQRIF